MLTGGLNNPMGRLVLYLPLAFIGMFFFDARGVFAAYAVANVLSGVLAYTWAVRTVRHVRPDSSAEVRA